MFRFYKESRFIRFVFLIILCMDISTKIKKFISEEDLRPLDFSSETKIYPCIVSILDKYRKDRVLRVYGVDALFAILTCCKTDVYLSHIYPTIATHIALWSFESGEIRLVKPVIGERAWEKVFSTSVTALQIRSSLDTSCSLDRLFIPPDERLNFFDYFVERYS